MKGSTLDKIDQLRERIQDLIAVDKKLSYDFCLNNWLLHFNMKVERTENAIREGMKWREENNIDILADQPWGLMAPGISKEIVIETGMFSKNGTPVMTFSAESVDFRTLFQVYGRDAVLRYYFQWLSKLERLMIGEQLKQFRRRNNGGGGKIEIESTCCPPAFPSAPILIVSYNNFSMWNATSIELLHTLMELVRCGMSYFPLPLSKVYVINMNKFSTLVYKMIKPILQTLPISIECFGTDRGTWSKALLEQINPDQLIPYFGGTKDVSSEKENLKI